MRRIAWFALLSLCLPAYAAPVSLDPQAFGDASSLADQLDHEPKLQVYRKQKFYPVFYPAFNKAVAECANESSSPSTEPFSFIIIVDAAGSLSEIDIDKSTDMSQCVTDRLRTLQFPKPPVAPFAERVDMKFKP